MDEDKKKSGDESENYVSIGLCIGLCLGVTLGLTV